MNESFHPTLYNGYNYLSIVVLKLKSSYVSKGDSDRPPVIFWEYDCRDVLRITNADIRCALVVPCDCSHM